MIFITRLFLLLLTFIGLGTALPADSDRSPVLKRSPSAATVDLSGNTGASPHYASGFIFGVPANGNQIPSHFYTDIAFNYLRSGGAQLPSPSLGWYFGPGNYTGRFASMLSDYKVAQTYGAKYIVILAALYGDVPSGGAWPGDNGNWTLWDGMVQRFISDVKANKINLAAFVVDIHNETDGVYWERSQAQYLELWRRTYAALRAAFGTSVTISGPSSAGEPSLSYSWWTNYSSYVVQNNCIPDQYTWHMESGGGNMNESVAGLNAVRAQYGLPSRPININEYATYNEECPSGSAWWIAQLERANVQGLRGNWQNYPALYDYMANLVSKPGANTGSYSPTSSGYYPNGQFQVYKYYAQNMTGYRVPTQPTSDYVLDVYATVDTSQKRVKVLTGSRDQTGYWYVNVNNVASLGLPQSGSVQVTVYSFVGSGGPYAEVDAPTFVGNFTNNYSGNTITFGVGQQNDATTNYAFEFTY